MPLIKKILIANRGEIAVRIIKTCRSLGISSVAVFSDSDREAVHVKEADEAVYIGNSPASESYLNIEKIISAVKKSGADSIHPGYGFLAENASFARRCEEEKIIFIGPSSGSIEKMGSKAGAKKIMRERALPVVPGYDGEDQSFHGFSEEAEKIGFPVLIKASAGGGGKGMRVVRKKEDLKNAFESAHREASFSFGNGNLILEKFFESSRHIEIQIFGDKSGNIIHLFERDCSIQRRHQKIIEESPSPVLTDELREKMAEAAVSAAKAINYLNAGTVEFILDSTGFYFLEVNTRLQVEHPVTEALTGLDLVKTQILIAEGRMLDEIIPPDLMQNIKRTAKQSHALECRLYAEDPANNHLPQTGKILLWKQAEVPGVRFDSGIATGSEIDIFYDPMLAKIITTGNNREEAVRKMVYALNNTVCLGITTNKEFLSEILENPEFQKGDYDTRFAENFRTGNKLQGFLPVFLIAALLYQWKKRKNEKNPLHELSGWRNNFYIPQAVKYNVDGDECMVNYSQKQGIFDISCCGRNYQAEPVSLINEKISFIVEEHLHIAYIAASGNNIFIHHSDYGQRKLVCLPQFPAVKQEEKKGSYLSPMPGEVVKIAVKQGDMVKKGDSLVVLLSMKMENTIVAHSDGKVEEIFIREKLFVQADTPLLKILDQE